uniref:Putative DNA-binding protein containing a Zn-ribbon domain n=1 Tax=uncultured marine thaumarchaeote AD1000_31_F12 TaxID=1455906 RepID=A0A075FPE7_9ARCH|nr:putative DNA-binding protein containing a Zn-ribbon domain [uncultured marine thaumarchaeote AD1000_31_F12]
MQQKMKSKGNKQGFECVKCGNRSVSKSVLEIPRKIQRKLYLPSVSAHRHLTRPHQRIKKETRIFNSRLLFLGCMFSKSLNNYFQKSTLFHSQTLELDKR